MYYTVKQGDCIASIAAKHGMPWKLLWEAGQNQELRDKRKDPNVLHPGDKVFVPDRTRKMESAETKKRHTFQVKLEKATLHLKLTANLKPLPNEPYVLGLLGEEIEGKTDGSGKLKADIPADLSTVTLFLPKRRQRYTLALGHIDPAKQASGAQGRLRNFRLYEGGIHGDLDDETKQAISDFQRIKGIEPTGELDDKTAKALEDEYGS